MWGAEVEGVFVSLPQRVQKTIATPLLAATLSLSALAVSALAGACAAPLDGPPRAIPVQPRLLVDGAMQLHARVDRVVIDEVLFHAPAVSLVEEGHLLANVLEGDERGPLLFRYDVTSDGFGDILGGERRWVLDPAAHGLSDLVFGFEPFHPDAATLAALEEQTGVPLAALAGHTASVHGYLLLRADSSSTAGTSSAFSTSCDGDPDGNPAAPPSGCAGGGGGAGARSDGDPDGNPSKPTAGTGDRGDGDPDGNPARPRSDDTADGDPDGNPARPKTGAADGDRDGDPDGNPARITDDDGDHLSKAQSHGGPGGPVGAAPMVGGQRVPFVLVLNDELALAVPVQSLLEGSLGPDEVLPIDLHVRLDELISDELLATLDEEAADQDKGLIVVEVPANGTVEIEVSGHGVHRVGREAVSTGGIRVVGGIR